MSCVRGGGKLGRAFGTNHITQHTLPTSIAFRRSPAGLSRNWRRKVEGSVLAQSWTTTPGLFLYGTVKTGKEGKSQTYVFKAASHVRTYDGWAALR